MEIYLPCKLGEQFEKLKFKDWVDGKRVYEEAGTDTLKGFETFPCQTRSLSIPTIFSKSGRILQYDPTGEFGQEFIPKYKINLDVETVGRLAEKGFPSGRAGRLEGLIIENDCLMASFILNERHEHIRYAIDDNIIYGKVNENVELSKVVFNKDKEKSRRLLKLQAGFGQYNKQAAAIQNLTQQQLEKIYNSDLFSLKRERQKIRKRDLISVTDRLKDCYRDGRIFYSNGWSENNPTVFTINKRGVEFDNSGIIHSINTVATALIELYGE